MIKVKVPIAQFGTKLPKVVAEGAEVLLSGNVYYACWNKEWIPLKPLSHYLKNTHGINRVIINGKAIPERSDHDPNISCDPSIFESYYLRDGDEVIVVPSLGIAIPAFIIAWGISYATAVAVGNFLIYTAISMIVSMLLSFLTAPPKSRGQAMTNSASTYGWEGYQNSYGPGGPMPVICGTHKASCKVIHFELEQEYVYRNTPAAFKPNHLYVLGKYCSPTISNGYIYKVTKRGTTAASEPVWPTTIGDTVDSGTSPNQVTFECTKLNNEIGKPDLSKTKTYVKMIGSFGHQVTAFNDIRINDTPIENFGSNVEIQTRLGTNPQDPLIGFDEDIVTRQIGAEVPLTMKWKASTNWYLNQYCLPTTEIDYETGGVHYSLVFECTTKGSTDSIEPTWGNPSPGDTFSDNTVVWTCRLDTRYTYTTPAGSDNYVTGTQLFFEAPAGLNASGPEGQVPNTVTMKVEHRPYTSDGSGVWVDDGTDEVSALKTSVCRWNKKIEGWDLGRYDIRVTKLKAKIYTDGLSAGDYSATHTIQVAQISEIRPCAPIFVASGTYTVGQYCSATVDTGWAYRVLVGGAAGAEPSPWPTTPGETVVSGAVTFQCTRITYPGEALIAIRGLAYAALNNSPPTLTAVPDGMPVPVWHPELGEAGEWVTEFSHNPLYIVRQIGIQKDDTDPTQTWGFGPWLTTDNFDDASLKDAAAYCDELVDGEARHTCNFVWNQRRKWKPLLMDILGPARILAYEVGGKYYFTPDRVTSPSQLFTLTNIKQGTLRTEWMDERQQYNALDVSYMAADQDYQPFPFRNDKLGYTPVKPKGRHYFGVTIKNEAVRDSNYDLNVIDLLHEMKTFKVGTDGVACLPGDVVSFCDEIPIGGPKSGRSPSDAADTSHIVLDEAVTIEAGHTYEITVRFSGGANPDLVETRAIVNGAGTYTTLTVNDPFTQAVKQDDMYGFGETALSVKDYKVIGMKSGHEPDCEIQLLEYNANVYTDTGSKIQPLPVPIPRDDAPPGPILAVDVTEEVQQFDNKVRVINLGLHWPKPEVASGFGPYLGANIYYAEPTIQQVLSEFAISEGWSAVSGSISENTTYGQFKKTSSMRLVTPSGSIGVASRSATLNLSSQDNAYIGFVFFIENRDDLVATGTAVSLIAQSSSGNYFHVDVEKDDIVNGFNFCLVKKEDMEEVGSPSWTSSMTLKVSLTPKAATVAAGSFDNAYFYGEFGWTFKTLVEGTSYRWSNVHMGEVLLFKLHSVSTGKTEQATPAYGGAYVTGFDTTAPAVPVDLVLDMEGKVITARVTPNTTDSDFAGNEFHFKKTGDEFTPDGTTLIKLGSNVCSYTVPTVGEWSVKVRSFDQALNWNPSTSAFEPNYSAYCDKVSITVAANAKRNTNAPTIPANLATAVSHVKKATRTTASVKFSWNAATDSDGDDIHYIVKYWIKTAEDITKAKTVQAKRGELYVSKDGLDIDTVYQWVVFAVDTWGNASTAQSPVAEVDTSHDTTYPDIACVTGLTATDLKNKVRIAWTVNAPALAAIVDFLEWVVFRNTNNSFDNGDEYAIIKQKAIRSWIDKDAEDGTTYYYALKIRDQSLQLSASFSMAASNSSIPIVPIDSTPPTQPTDVVLTVESIGTSKDCYVHIDFTPGADDNLDGHEWEVWDKSKVSDEVLGGDDGLNYTCKKTNNGSILNRPGMIPPKPLASRYWVQAGTNGIAWENGTKYFSQLADSGRCDKDEISAKTSRLPMFAEGSGDKTIGQDDGLTYTCIKPHLSIQGSGTSGNRPGCTPTKTNAARYWSQTGSGGVTWVAGKLYKNTGTGDPIEWTGHVRAYDVQKNYSLWSDEDAPPPTPPVTGTDTTPPDKPTDVTLSVQGMTLTATIGTDNRPTDFSRFDFHFSQNTGFTPDATTLKDTGNKLVGSYTSTVEGDWYCKVIGYDTSGNASVVSDEEGPVVAKMPFIPPLTLATPTGMDELAENIFTSSVPFQKVTMWCDLPADAAAGWVWLFEAWDQDPDHNDRPMFSQEFKYVDAITVPTVICWNYPFKSSPDNLYDWQWRVKVMSGDKTSNWTSDAGEIGWQNLGREMLSDVLTPDMNPPKCWQEGPFIWARIFQPSIDAKYTERAEWWFQTHSVIPSVTDDPTDCNQVTQSTITSWPMGSSPAQTIYVFARYKLRSGEFTNVIPLGNVSYNPSMAMQSIAALPSAGSHASDILDSNSIFVQHGSDSKMLDLCESHHNWIGWPGEIETLLTYFGGSWEDKTAEAKSATVNDVPLMPSSPVVGDAIFIAAAHKFNAINFIISTPGAGVWEFGIYVWTGTEYTEVVSPNVWDETTGFRAAAGMHQIRFYGGLDDWVISGGFYQIKIALKSFTSKITAPIASQVTVECALVATETLDIKGGTGAIKITIPALADTYGRRVTTLDTSEFNKGVDRNLVIADGYLYFPSIPNVYRPEIRINKIKTDMSESAVLIIPHVNPFVNSMVASADGKFLYIVHSKVTMDPPPATDKPQVTRVSLSNFASYQTLTLPYDIGFPSITQCALQGDYLYFAVQEDGITGNARIYKINISDMSVTTSVLDTIYTSPTGMAVDASGTYIYMGCVQGVSKRNCSDLAHVAVFYTTGVPMTLAIDATNLYVLELDKLTKITLGETAVDVAYMATVFGGNSTEYTTEANSPAANDVPLMAASPVEGDCVILACPQKFFKLNITLGTSGVGTWTLGFSIWNGTTYEDIAPENIVDNTDGFTDVPGTHQILINGGTENWDTFILNGVPVYFFRIALTSFTSVTTVPLASRIRIVGTLLENATKAVGAGKQWNEWMTLDATNVYVGQFATSAEADGEIYQLQIADWTTDATKVLTGEKRIYGVAVDATYVYGMRHISSPFKILSVLLSDFTTLGPDFESGYVNLSAANYIKQNVKSSRAGAGLFALCIMDSVAGWSTYPVTILEANKWQEVIWDISAIASASRDAIQYIGIQILDVSVEWTLLIDPIHAYDNAGPKFKFLDGTTENVLTAAESPLPGNIPISTGNQGRVVWTPKQKYIRAGANTISEALAAMANGDSFLLEPGAFTQNETMQVPDNMLQFAINGFGPGICKITLTADVDGIVAGVSTPVEQCNIGGFSVKMNATSSTRKAIYIQGARDPDNDDPSNPMQVTIEKVHVASGASGKYFGVGFQLENCFMAEINNCYVFGRSQLGIGVQLLSSVACRINGGVYQWLAIAVDCEKSGSYAYGSEGPQLQGMKTLGCNYGAWLDAGCIGAQISGCSFDYICICGVYEDSDGGGHHNVSGSWFGFEVADGAGTGVYLQNVSSTVKGNNFFQNVTGEYTAVRISGIMGSLNSITGNTCDGMDRGVEIINAGSGSGENGISVNTFYQTRSGSGYDIVIGSGSVSNVVTGNVNPNGITDNGTTTVKSGNLNN